MRYYRLFVFFIFIYLIFSFNVRADVCAYTSEEIVRKAEILLKKQSSVVDFCSTCDNEIPQITSIQTIDIKNIPASNDKQLYLNGTPRDLAHIFIYIPEKEQYENLALTIKCPEAEKNKNLLLASFKDFENLKEKQNLCSENDNDCLYNTAHSFYLATKELCQKQTSVLNAATTSEMQVKAYEYNSCIVTELKKELAGVLNDKILEQAEAEIDTIVKNSNLFYAHLFSENKFCYPHCGTISVLFPPAETEVLLEKIYEKVILIKLKKGY